MKTRVIRGWVGKTRDLTDLGDGWIGTGDAAFLDFDFDIVCKVKGGGIPWGRGNWPPKRLTITFELED